MWRTQVLFGVSPPLFWMSGKKAPKRGIHFGFETHGRRHQKSKAGHHKKDICVFHKRFKKLFSFAHFVYLQTFFFSIVILMTSIWRNFREVDLKSEIII